MREQEERRIKLIAHLMLLYKQPFSEFAKLEIEILQVLFEEADRLGINTLGKMP